MRVAQNVVTLLLLLCTMAAHGQALFQPSGTNQQSLDPFLRMLKDPTGGKLTVDEIAAGQAGEFAPAGDTTLTNGVVFDNSVFWARVDVDLSHATEPTAYLVFQPELMGRIDVFFPHATGGFGCATIDERSRRVTQDVAIQSQMVKLPTPRQQAYTTFYVRFEPRLHALITGVSWATPQGAIEEATSAQFMRGLLLGALCILVFYNAFVFFTTRDTAYLLYVYYLSCFTLMMALIMGLKMSFLPFGATATTIIVVNAAIVHSSIWFVQKFMALRIFMPKTHRVLTAIQWSLVACAVVALYGTPAAAYPLSLALIFPNMVLLMLASFMRWRQGFIPARFSAIGLLAHVLITGAYLAEFMQLIPTEKVTIYWVGAAGVWEALCFSFALAYRVRLAEQVKQQLIEAQKISLFTEQQALAQAQLAQRDKNIFLSMIGHELRSPLQSIVAALDVEALTDRGPEHQAFLHKIDWAVKRIDSQHRDLLILSVGEAGKLEMRPEIFEVGDLVEDVISSLATKAKDKNLQLHVKAPSEAVFVVADPKRIEQVLANLVENAVKYTAHGSITIHYLLLGQTELQLVVTDTGIGISEEDQRTLFTPYTRFATIDGSHNSSGIGLAVVKTLLTHLGGTVTLNSKMHAGSTFTATLPVAIPGKTSPQMEKNSTAHILIIDDRKDVLEGLCAIGQALGYHCDRAESAAVGANYLGAQAYDIVFIDLDMPVKTGLELASETRRGKGLNSATRLVAITADLSATRVCGPFDDVAHKPIDKAQFQKLVRKETYGRGTEIIRLAPGTVGASVA
jgi:signal transduction histidine kinase